MRGRVIFKCVAEGLQLESQVTEAKPLELMALGVLMQEVGLDLTKQALKALKAIPGEPTQAPLIVPPVGIVSTR